MLIFRTNVREGSLIHQGHAPKTEYSNQACLSANYVYHISTGLQRLVQCIVCSGRNWWDLIYELGWRSSMCNLINTLQIQLSIMPHEGPCAACQIEHCLTIVWDSLCLVYNWGCFIAFYSVLFSNLIETNRKNQAWGGSPIKAFLKSTHN